MSKKVLLGKNVPHIELLPENDIEKYYKAGLFEQANALKFQNDCSEMINEAEDRYKKDGNINVLIDFWESYYHHNNLSFLGSGWIFRLMDLYVQSNRYDAALIYINDMDSFIEEYKCVREYILDKKDEFLKNH